MTTTNQDDFKKGDKGYRLSLDTALDAEELLFELLGQRSSAEKLLMVCQANSMVRDLTMCGLKERYPNDSEAQLKVRLAELLHGEEFSLQIKHRLLQGQDSD
jgi:hypothetical protein